MVFFHAAQFVCFDQIKKSATKKREFGGSMKFQTLIQRKSPLQPEKAEKGMKYGLPWSIADFGSHVLL